MRTFHTRRSHESPRQLPETLLSLLNQSQDLRRWWNISICEPNTRSDYFAPRLAKTDRRPKGPLAHSKNVRTSGRALVISLTELTDDR